MNKQNKVILIVSLISLLLIAVGASYAFFTANITGGESASTISTTAGTLSLTVNGGNAITVSDTFPQNNAIVRKHLL